MSRRFARARASLGRTRRAVNPARSRGSRARSPATLGKLALVAIRVAAMTLLMGVIAIFVTRSSRKRERERQAALFAALHRVSPAALYVGHVPSPGTHNEARHQHQTLAGE